MENKNKQLIKNRKNINHAPFYWGFCQKRLHPSIYQQARDHGDLVDIFLFKGE